MQGDRWRRRAGLVPIMNPIAIDRAEIYREPLTLHASPLDWMRAGGAGCVIVDPTANLRLYLGGVERINLDDLRFGAAIERRLIEPSPCLPKIYVRAEARVA
jgi:hypothetical protein